MGILVLEAAAGENMPGLRQRLDDALVGVALLAVLIDDAGAVEARRVLGVKTVGVDGMGDVVGDCLLYTSRGV